MPRPKKKLFVHKTAREAWNFFRQKCGLDEKERDADFLEQLKEQLDPNASDLDEAIDKATNDELIVAIFSCVSAFVEMSKDILDFFKRAEVSKGAGQWALVIDDVPLGLEDFLEFVGQSEKAIKRIQRRQLTLGAAMRLLTIMRRDETSAASRARSAKVESESHLPYAEWPKALTAEKLPAQLRDMAEIGASLRSQLCQSGLTRNQLLEIEQPVLGPGAILDGRDLQYAERDFWFSAIIHGLDSAKNLQPRELEELGEKLSAVIGTLSLIYVPTEIEIGDLTKILSLPVWERRHEVYAVWIATRIVDAFPQGDTTIHNENGTIRFPFRKTKIASLPCEGGEIALYGERKQLLANPIGPGRKNATQPDFGLWSAIDEKHTCELIIEVKHYLQAAARPFTEALIDYARAHPAAQVVLVNYGPTSDMLDRLDKAEESVRDRCHLVGHLTPEKERTDEPIRGFVTKALRTLGRTERLLLIDVSGSMRPYVTVESFREWLLGHDNTDVIQVSMVALEELWTGPRTDAFPWLFNLKEWGIEDLAAAAQAAFHRARHNEELWIVTDESGCRGLDQSNQYIAERHSSNLPPNLILVSVKRQAKIVSH